MICTIVLSEKIRTPSRGQEFETSARNLLYFIYCPFFTLDNSEVSAKIEYIKVRVERFQDLLNNTNTAQNRDFQDLRRGGCAGGLVLSSLLFSLPTARVYV